MSQSAYIEQLEAEKKELVEVLQNLCRSADGIPDVEASIPYTIRHARAVLAKHQPANTDKP